MLNITRRSALGFQNAVFKEFAFLEKEFGYWRAESNETRVRYETDASFVNIYHGRTSFEVGVEIGQRASSPDREERFGLIDILELAGVRRELGFEGFQASDRARVEMVVKKAAEFVHLYAVHAIRGEEEAFSLLRATQQKLSDSFLNEMAMSRLREQASAAWAKKDYAKLISLYEPVAGKLSAPELKKLDYARKRASGL
jgi:hypothetical protein